MVDLERVFAELGPVLGRVAATYASSRADRDDLSQEIAIALVQALPRYRGDSSLRTYVLRVAHNCGIRRIARRSAARRAGSALTESDHASTGPGPERETAAREEVEQLGAAVRELPLGLRQVLALTLEGLSQREIGEVLGLAENAVSARLHRARSALRARLHATPERKGRTHG
jgi:RNA polymerase sigma-70 factor (ECF subfamily)